MKKILVSIVTLALVFSLAGCSLFVKSSISSEDFIAKAEEAGYVVEVEESDKDGMYTAWASMYAEDASEDDAPLYTVIYTWDISVGYAESEFVRGTNEFGSGSTKSASGMNYEYEVYSGSGVYGIALRVDEMNLFTLVDSEYKDEVKAFFQELGYKL